MRCFGCGKTGHLVRACPQRAGSETPPSDESDGSVRGSNGPDQTAQHDGVVEADSPVTDGENASKMDSITAEKPETPEPTVAKNTKTDPVPSDGVSNTGTTVPTAQAEQASPEQSVEIETETDVELMMTQDSVTEDNVVVLMENTDEAMMETEQTVLKTPVKRKTREHDKTVKAAKKAERKQAGSASELDSEESPPDLTVCVTTEGNWVGKKYNATEIRHFLKITKNMRMVPINRYFPDLNKLHIAIKGLMGEGCFEDKEVYRLKKIVTKINNLLDNDDDETS
ncbi:hypothetical protein QTP70_009937 [Hemibagrus guttatus]|uniref:CCHC-type domain-containing protein n=1 Tax=Hemibagrus guttatus TaxID=175788 RepID=A0AAE0URL4_9TELE|nr:hypothetical protein QTP70_009937 [Hemibagrus guttatus]